MMTGCVKLNKFGCFSRHSFFVCAMNRSGKAESCATIAGNTNNVSFWRVCLFSTK